MAYVATAITAFGLLIAVFAFFDDRNSKRLDEKFSETDTKITALDGKIAAFDNRLVALDNKFDLKLEAINGRLLELALALRSHSAEVQQKSVSAEVSDGELANA